MNNSGNSHDIWYSKDGPGSSVVLISRVRIARNADGYVFPSRIKKNDAEQVQSLVFNAFSDPDAPCELQAVKLSDLEPLSRLILCERGVLDTDCGLEPWKGLLFSEDGDLSICVNMEDHVRIAVFSAGLSLSDACDKADKIEKFIPPKKGRKHILYIIRELIDFTPESSGTNIGLALEYMTNAIKKRCTTFLISDFIDGNDYKNALSIANRRHDLVAIQVYDRRESQLPNVGLIKMQDAERGTELWVDSSSANVRARYADWWNNRQDKMLAMLRKSRVDLATIATDDDFVVALMNLFKRRG